MVLNPIILLHEHFKVNLEPPLKFLTLLLGSGLGSGYFPIASGTAGSFVALLIWLVLPEMTPLVQITFIIIAFLIGIPICTVMENRYGHDPKQAVWDEFAGQWTALLLLPKTFPIIAASFLIFRVLDIWKPYPARASQDLPGGWGIMVDDLIVGIYTCLLLHLYLYIF
ncbi:phosphatidylglycerophosphatase A [candidate division LCP-89 bacterium B3_LCP]|uniref:Phosphatidylglycerophosphatase A n=1 Tax=candidate division LCP-89 bacterium B3_LCP TaxID=2012998 RepID=A0A532V5A7_UNCL8|nr:MAG: phosphatidylglycerophosphatase A [candidate division LCP-89 bacterium B3_LCP]